MYNSGDLLLDSDLTFLSFNQCVNHSFTCDDVLSSYLWSVSRVGELVYRCVPLFNCDLIESSNGEDVVLDGNRCLIMVYDDDTVVSCSSDDTGGVHYHSVRLEAFTPYTRLDVLDTVTVYCIVFDEYLNTVNNVLVDVLVDEELVSQVYTDNDGRCSFSVREACSVQFRYGELLSNIITVE